MLERLKSWARSIKRDVIALYLAGRDVRTPRAAKAVALAVAIYALSPIDLIPDFIPVLGYLDDLLIVPVGIMIAVRMIPDQLMAEFRQQAVSRGRIPPQWAGAAAVVTIWLLAAGAVAWWVLR